jgi:hypothetical protein
MLLRLVLTATLSLSLFLISIAADAQPTIYGKKVTTSRTDDIPTDRKWQHAYSEFKAERQYNSALYVSDTSYDWYYHTGNYSMKTALAAGKIACETATQGTCSLYAISYPAGVDPSTFPEGLSNHAALTFNGKYKRRQKDQKWGAFAISGLNSYGYSHGFATEDQAKKAALRFCKNNVERQGRKSGILLLLKFSAECKIVDVHTPTK